MKTRQALHEAGECDFDTCGFCWNEHQALLEAWQLEVDCREEPPRYFNEGTDDSEGEA